MIAHKHNKTTLPLLTSLLLLIGSASVPVPAAAQTPAQTQSGTGLQRSPWLMHRGIIPTGQTNDIAKIALAKYDDPKGFNKINIPPIDDAGWVTPPRDAKNNISLDEASALAGCSEEVDFTYFQTEVYVPKDAKITDFQVTFDQVDDLARIYILNTKSKDAHSEDIVGKSVATSDLLPLLALGEKNRVVIAQFDSCADRNSIKNIQIEVEATGADGKAVEEIIPVANRFYVDKDAKGKANGLSWADAYTNVQDALAVAVGGSEIWVADGIYYPDVGGGKVNNDQTASFSILSGVSLYGGFTGKEKTLAERNWAKNPTILSGDIDQNDKTQSPGLVIDTKAISGTNSTHVIFLDGTRTTVTRTTVIDGFMVTAGQADGEKFPEDAGGGLFCHSFAAGECSPTLTNVLFRGNFASGNGGGMFNDGRNGGNGSPTLTNVFFFGNSASYGGGLYNYGGGANGLSSPALTNVIFAENSAKQWGGALLNQGEAKGNSSPVLINVTFRGNSAQQGGAIFNYVDEMGIATPTLTNSILWKNTASKGPSIYNKNAKSVIGYSIVEGGPASISGEGTQSSDYKNTNKTDDPLFGDSIPGDACGVQRLKAGSPAIGVGDPKAVPANIKTDMAGNSRIVNGKVSLGACEVIK